MVKYLITVTTHLLIQDTLKTIYYACTILDFSLLTEFALHKNKTLLYMDYALYRLDKSKIAFENYHPIIQNYSNSLLIHQSSML